MEGRVLTCVYCGQEYPQETPAWGNEVLTEHIRACPKHPIRKAEADVALLRGALAGLVRSSDKAELEQMELAMRLLPAPAADKAASIDAIHALLATLPNAYANTRSDDSQQADVDPVCADCGSDLPANGYCPCASALRAAGRELREDGGKDA